MDVQILWVWEGPEIEMSHQLPGDVNAAGPEPHTLSSKGPGT